MLVEPAVFVGLVWTNGGHATVWTAANRAFLGEYSVLALEFGLAFWGHQVYSTLLVTAGALLLFRMVLGTTRPYRSQSTALLLAITIPMAGNALSLFEVLPAGLDPGGLAYVLTGVVLSVAMFRTRLLRIAPAVRELGREEVLTELDDAVFILDETDRVIETNPAGERLLDGDDSSLGRPLDAVFPALADALDTDTSRLRLDVSRSVRYLDVQDSALSRGYGTLSGRLVSLRDVTEQRRREQRLDVLNRFSGTTSVTNSPSSGGTSTSHAGPWPTRAPVPASETAIETVDTIVARSAKVSHLSRLFETDTGGTFDLAEHLHADLETIRREHPEATIEVSLPDPLLVEAGPTVTVAFDELLDNAIVHNDSEHPRIGVDLDDTGADGYVVVTITDDGPGIDEQEYRTVAEGHETPLAHASGVGLWLANWVVEHNGGGLSFETSARGTKVSVRLPRAEDRTADVAAREKSASSPPGTAPDGGDR